MTNSGYNTGLWWMLLIITIMILAVVIYKIVFKSETAFIQLTIAAGLSVSVLRVTPLFVKYKALSIIPAAAAVIFLILSILEALKK